MDPRRPLSEIGHLFLSDIRSRTPGGVRPQRVPPKKNDASIDITPEEFAASLGADASDADASDAQPRPSPEPGTPFNSAAASAPAGKMNCASVVLSSHLHDENLSAVHDFARQLASETRTVGLIEAGSAELIVTCFEQGAQDPISPLAVDLHDAKIIADNLSELTCDVDRWLISLPDSRTPESRELLRAAPHWVMLTTADHEGVIATYRALKGLAELGRRRISLVVLDARDEAHADAVFRKLDAVSRQFLHCALEEGTLLRPARNVIQHTLLHARQLGDEAPAHWPILGELLASAAGPALNPPIEKKPPMKFNIADSPKTPAMEMPIQHEMPDPAPQMMPRTNRIMPEVIDLPGDASDRSILDAVTRQGGADGRWITCPIHPPMCPDALLAVGRDQRLMLLAVAGPGLGQLLSIGQAHRWMSENTELIRMALPQLAIDASAAPAITLFVDHNDLSADILQPMLQTGIVTIHAYRRIKWGAKTGLLLEAA